ncbi:PTS mannose transporter subunit IIAB [Sodalis sp. CWE]|uniref:PTS mannose transporter subunit IIAB n=1 Tax=Sodalis sp. CWE TaxID=2803816 RepID=UPI001C7D38A4|nr:PTS mannose transporter subunit IIAB [Sodalis sp. CWE]
MSIAIVVSTHGSVATQLLKTTEMILGVQNNFSCVDFFSEENTEILAKKYFAELENLDTKEGVLFLVDIWGGTPFNAASQVIFNKKNYGIITGVNIPMLIEIFITRDDHSTFHELMKIAVAAGRSEIKALETTSQFKNESSVVSTTLTSDKQIKDLTENNHEGHMNIVLVRIDDRLIHGQVVTRWAKESNVKRIIVVNNEIALDLLRSNLIKQASPLDIKAHVVSIEKAIRVYENPKYANERIMFLFTKPEDVLHFIEGGVTINSINIGGMAFYQGKIQINNAISVNEKDIEAFKKLDALGIELEVRKVPSDSPLKLMDLIKKIR